MGRFVFSGGLAASEDRPIVWRLESTNWAKSLAVRPWMAGVFTFFLWTASDGMEDLGVLTTGDDTYATGSTTRGRWSDIVVWEVAIDARSSGRRTAVCRAWVRWVARHWLLRST